MSRAPTARMPMPIVAAQGVDFDSISGATVTSNAVKDATKKAMAAAGLIEAEDTTVADAECDVVIVGCGAWRRA